MIFYVGITIVSILAYVFLILFILQRWTSPQILESTDNQIPIGKNNLDKPLFSILIPVRNEEENIKACLDSILLNIDLNKYEIIVIDDNSTDQTHSILKTFLAYGVTVLTLGESVERSHKKAALNLGLKNAKGIYIIQIDGDVIVHPKYLKTIEKYVLKHQPDFLAAPVVLSTSKSLLGNFQVLDCSGMMMVTQAGIDSKSWFMANGANMIYKRSNYIYNVKGKASGDDINNIQSVASSPDKVISFLKNTDAIVETKPEKTWTELYYQRLRWGTKNRLSKDPKMVIMMLIPFVNSCLILIHPILAVFVFSQIAWTLFCFHIFIKLTLDYVYLKEGTSFFGKQDSMKYFVRSSILHVMYISTIGLFSLFMNKYKWKDRVVE